MKLYVFPTERKCNGKCNFCITKERNLKGKEFLELKDLERALNNLEIDKIEITGGGEPLLNPHISEIIEICSERAPVQLYTNGKLAEKADLSKLNLLCISRAHYDNEQNKRIMGVDYNLDKIMKKNIPVKFSLLLHKKGIDFVDGLVKYLDWAKTNKSKCVVVRELMPLPNNQVHPDFIDSREVCDYFTAYLNRKSYFIPEGKSINYRGMDVFFKYKPMNCYENLFLHANGKLRRGIE